MKTNFLQKGSRSRDSYGAYAWALLALFALFFGFIFSSSTERALQFVLSPFWAVGSAVEGRTLDLFSVVFSNQGLLEDNKRLSANLEALQARQADYDALKSQNDELSRELGRKPAGKSVAAAVLLRPPELPYDTFLLDLGTADGVMPGDAVLSDNGAYLGSISEVYDRSSKAVLASSSGIETKALIGTVLVSFIGKGGGVYEGRIPQVVAVSLGEAVPVALGNFILGTVTEVEADANNAYRKIILSSGVNLSETRYVFIEKNSE